jgi:hypothetical protein
MEKINNLDDKEVFLCSNCGRLAPLPKLIGTENRNHCPFCLWSKHLDLRKAGDRKSNCKAGMKPIALTFKQEGKDKWGRLKQGELMLVHKCTSCGKISINRIAGDDNSYEILEVWENSQKSITDLVGQLQKEKIKMLAREDKKEIVNQLFGKDFKMTK